MGVHEEVADAGGLQDLVDARDIAALRQPHAARAAAEVLFVLVDGGLDLRPERRPVAVPDGEEHVRAVAGDEIQLPAVLERPERGGQVAVVAPERVADGGELLPVQPGHAVERGLGPGPPDLAVAEVDLAVELRGVPLEEQRVAHHAQERRGDRQRHPEVDVVPPHRLEGVEQRDVGLGHRLEEPLLLEEVLVLGMAHERQVGMEDEGEVSLGHGFSPPGGKSGLPLL